MIEKQTRRGVAVDFFSGVGGFSIGTEAAGFDLRLSVEQREPALRAHNYNFPYGQHLAADIGAITADEIRQHGLSKTEIDVITTARQSDLDLLAGGPPCQGISVMGRRNPSDPRNDLLQKFTTLATELQPRYVTFENVPNLLSAEYREVLDRALDKLLKANYNVVTPRVLSALDFGVPQRRSRAFIMAYRQGEAAPTYPEPTHRPALTGDFLLKATPTVADALSGLPLADDYPILTQEDHVAIDVWPEASNYFAMQMRGLANDPDDLSYRRETDHNLLTNSYRSAHTAESIARFKSTPPGQNERTSRRHRLDPNGYSPTLRAGTEAERGGFTACSPLHPFQPRTITVREAARLQSIPDWFRLTEGPWHGHRQIGNSVPPLLGRAVMHQIRKAAGLNPCQPNEVLKPSDPELLRVAGRRTPEAA